MRHLPLLASAAAAALWFGCPSAPSEDDDSQPTPAVDVDAYDFEAAGPWFECPSREPAEGAVVVPIMEDVAQAFGGENLRTVEVTASLPEGSWKQVGLRFELSCPDGGQCDFWDRAGFLEVGLSAPGAEEQEWLEVLRHITPYHRGMCNFVDVTPLASVLAGERAFRSHIDTWVGPGHAQGDGWIVDAELVYIPGTPETNVEVLNVWGHRSVTVGNTDPAGNVDSQIDPASVTIPEEVDRVFAHLTTTGHGFGFSGNCAEFCQMQHEVLVNGTPFSWSGWRSDCAENPVSPQDGTWQYARNGWCPGAVALGGLLDITEAVVPGEAAEIDLDILSDRGTEYRDVSGEDGDPFTRVSLRLYAQSE